MTRKYGNSETEYREAAKNSISIAEMLRHLGLEVKGGNYKTINRKILQYNIDISHFLGHAHSRGKTLVENPISGEAIKRRLIKERDHKCERCNNTEWFDIPITLEVDHIDGDTDNNEYNNLKLLCPNCHSQTPTWRRAKSSFLKDLTTICSDCQGYKQRESKRCVKCYREFRKVKNPVMRVPREPKITNQCSCGTLIADKSAQCTKCSHKKQLKIDWPDTNALIADIKASSYSAMGRKLGVSDNAIRKYLKNNGIDPKTFNPVV